MTKWLLPQWLQDWCRKLADDLVPIIAFFGKVFNPVIALVLGAYEVTMWLWAQFYGLKEKTGAFYDAYQSFKAYVGDSVFNPFPPAVTQGVAFMNTFFPVTEALILTGMIAALYVVATTVRIVKSCIPTVAT